MNGYIFRGDNSAASFFSFSKGWLTLEINNSLSYEHMILLRMSIPFQKVSLPREAKGSQNKRLSS